MQLSRIREKNAFNHLCARYLPSTKNEFAAKQHGLVDKANTLHIAGSNLTF
jgi:hypothetical protein